MIVSSSLSLAHKIVLMVALAALASLSFSGCKGKNESDGAPPPAKVIQVADMNLVTIDANDVAKFPLTAATQIESASELTATGSVFPDISREIPVISLANGRVVDIKARLDDNVKKGQLLLKVQSPDITAAFDTYLKAANDEQLANKAFVRADDLFKHGAISQAMLEQAEDTEKDAKADLMAADGHRLEPRRPDLLVHAGKHQPLLRRDGEEVAGRLDSGEILQGRRWRGGCSQFRRTDQGVPDQARPEKAGLSRIEHRPSRAADRQQNHRGL